MPKCQFLKLCLLITCVAACGPDVESSPATAEAPGSAEPLLGQGWIQPTLWQHPPTAYRPYLRWWWPGGGADLSRLEHELTLFHSLGFGGVEVVPLTAGLGDAEHAADGSILNTSGEHFFELVDSAALLADELGLGFDMSASLGWPAASPQADTLAARELAYGTQDVVGPMLVTTLPPPNLGLSPAGAVDDLSDQDAEVVAVVALELLGSATFEVVGRSIDITPDISLGGWAAPSGNWRVFAFYETQTGQTPEGHAYHTRAPVIDHFGGGIFALVAHYAVRLAELDHPPDTLVVDNFEFVSDLPWTTGLQRSFRDRYGYSIEPVLPLAIPLSPHVRGGASWSVRYIEPHIGERLREDYEALLGERLSDDFVTGLTDFAHQFDIDVRLQAHGSFGNPLDLYALADIPESETNFASGAFDFVKLATSAGHVTGAQIISAELPLAAPTLSRNGGRMMGVGINRMTLVGFPHDYQLVDGRQWSPARDAAETVGWPLSTSQASLQGDPEEQARVQRLATVFARLGYANSVGDNVAVVARLHTSAQYFRETDDPVGSVGESRVSDNLNRAGYTWDWISPRQLSEAAASGQRLRVGEAEYQALLLSDVSALSPEVLGVLLGLASDGVPVFLSGRSPQRTVGWANHLARDAAVLFGMLRLSERSEAAEDDPAAALARAGIQPSLRVHASGSMPFSVVHRRSGQRDLFLFFNDSEEERSVVFGYPDAAARVFQWDPATGAVQPCGMPSGDEVAVGFALGAHEATVLTFEP